MKQGRLILGRAVGETVVLKIPPCAEPMEVVVTLIEVRRESGYARLMFEADTRVALARGELLTEGESHEE